MLSYYEIKISTNHIDNFKLINNLLEQFLIRSSTSLPKKYRRFAVIKSPHVNKKSKEHFQSLKYTRLFFVRISIKQLKTFFLHSSNNIWIRIKKIEKQLV